METYQGDNMRDDTNYDLYKLINSEVSNDELSNLHTKPI